MVNSRCNGREGGGGGGGGGDRILGEKGEECC